MSDYKVTNLVGHEIMRIMISKETSDKVEMGVVPSGQSTGKSPEP